MLTVGTKVIVAVNDIKGSGWPRDKDRDKYVGCTGIMSEIDERMSNYTYVVKFDDVELEKKNEEEGIWLWSEKELIPLEADNTDYVR